MYEAIRRIGFADNLGTGATQTAELLNGVLGRKAFQGGSLPYETIPEAAAWLKANSNAEFMAVLRGAGGKDHMVIVDGLEKGIRSWGAESSGGRFWNSRHHLI
ncbi:hypothetical protein [Leptonema illini]|uniref:hypothetical protein n=1 Tax=Leptonema illini TaxID=183 RepID=UPI0005933756|nr:hypothetical protein [Leptonema illini]